jgi:hypothetical protein
MISFNIRTCSLKNAPDALKIFPFDWKNLQGTVVLYKNPISILIISNALSLPHIISDIVTNLCLLFSTCMEAMLMTGRRARRCKKSGIIRRPGGLHL